MFKDKQKRFMSRAILERLHVEIQVILWKLIDEQRSQDLELDYLQVFNLKVKDDKQQVTHQQEVPERVRANTILLNSTQPVNTTVWCIDSVEHQIMLFPEDY